MQDREKKELVERPNKTALKREFKALEEFVRLLVDTSDNLLKQLPLSDFITEEIQSARDMSKSAYKRQIGYITKRIVDEPTDEAKRKLESLKQPDALANTHFHKLEKWRDQLLRSDQETINTLVTEHNADRQQLNQFVRNANKERELEKPPRSARLLFQYLRNLTEEQRAE